LKGARVVTQGFGAVGKHAARFLAEKSAILVAASDTSGTVADPAGLDLAHSPRSKRLAAHCMTAVVSASSARTRSLTLIATSGFPSDGPMSSMPEMCTG